MSEMVLDRPIASLTLRDLKDWIQELARQTVREERSYYLDAEGYLVFTNEKDYATYLKRQPDKYPGEIKSYFIDKHGLKVCYSDYEPTPEKAKELKEARKQIAAGQVRDFEVACRDLGLRRKSVSYPLPG